MGDIADLLVNEGVEHWVDHADGECGDDCPYCPDRYVNFKMIFRPRLYELIEKKAWPIALDDD